MFRKSVHHNGHLCMSARVECAFTSPVIIELGMLVMYYMQSVMSLSVVWCRGVVVRLSVHVHFSLGLSPRDS